MIENKFSFNPFNGDFIKSGYNHAFDLKNKIFKEYIRGCIIENNIFLRCYYPYDEGEIIAFTLPELYKKSKSIINQFLPELKKKIKSIYGIKSFKIVYNADKDLFNKGID